MKKNEINLAVDGGVPGVVGLLSLFSDKRAGNAAIQDNSKGKFPGFDLEMSGHKKSLREQAFNFLYCCGHPFREFTALV